MSPKVQSVANYLVDSYERITRTPFNNDEITLQKLMYFSQKISLAMQGTPIIDEDFEGWRHGPVLPSLRFFFEYYNPDNSHSDLSETEKYIIDNTIYMYGQYAPWTLRNMSHEENAWKKSRNGLAEGENGSKVIELDDIREDAKQLRLYDHQFDMYFDEFEDIEGEFTSV